VADAYTGAAASSFDQTAYDLRAFYALRPELYYDPIATVKPTMQSFNGAAVIFTIQSDLSAATTTLAESTDVSAVAMADSQVTLTLGEYGNAVITTGLLRGTTFINFDPVVANVLGFNAGLSLDSIARNTLQAGSNVTYPSSWGLNGTTRNTIIPTDVLKAAAVRQAVAQLRRAFVQPINGYYVGIIHPDVAYDIKGESGGGNWRDPHIYSDPADIWNGEIGVFESVRFIETPRAPLFADAGSSTTNTDVYGTLFLGQEAMAKAHSMSDGNGPLPTIVPGPVTDHLRRFVPMGWYWLGAYGIFRQACVRRFESASSIGLNSSTGSN
jgi:N4-gp56 family major capsid protein